VRSVSTKKRALYPETRLNACSPASWPASAKGTDGPPTRLLSALWEAERELWYQSKANVRLRAENNRLRYVLAEVRDYLIDTNGKKPSLTAMEVRWIQKLGRL
jgi:hypothetical protein